MTAPADVSVDPVVAGLREEISAIDRDLVALVNRRLTVVERLHAYKRANGLALLDPVRERQLTSALAELNAGPLSDDGLRELHAFLLAFVKRELSRG